MGRFRAESGRKSWPPADLFRDGDELRELGARLGARELSRDTDVRVGFASEPVDRRRWHDGLVTLVRSSAKAEMPGGSIDARRFREFADAVRKAFW